MLRRACRGQSIEDMSLTFLDELNYSPTSREWLL